MKRINYAFTIITAFVLAFGSLSTADAQSTCATAQALVLDMNCGGSPFGIGANSGDPTGNDDTDGNVCSSFYSGGDDYIFSFTASTGDLLQLELYAENTWTGIMVTEGCPTTGTCFADATSSSSNESLTTPPMTPGTTYYIHISTFPSPQSSGQFCLDASLMAPPTPPANDLCGGAITLMDGDSDTQNTDLAADAGTPVNGCGVTPTEGIWYTFTGNGGDATVSTGNTGTDFDTQLSVYSGSCGSLSCVDGDDDGGPGLQSEVTFLTTAGTTYYAYVHGFAGATGNVETSLTLEPAPVPCTDNEVTLTVITDNFASETSWSLLDDNGSTVASIAQGAYSNNSTNIEEFCLPDGCYEFTIFDSFGDGISGSNSYTLTDVDGNVLAADSDDWDDSETTSFCLPFAPCDIALTGSTTTPETCPGDNDGSISVSASCTSCAGIEYSIGGAYQSSGTFSGLAAGSYTVTARDTGDPSCSATTTVSVGAGSGGAILPPWTPYDVGSSGTLGNDFAQNPCDGSGIFTIDAGGNNAVTSTTDAVGFVGQTLCGNGGITLKLESVSQYGYGGPMIRESAAAGAKQVSMFGNLTNIIRWENRTATNGPKTVQSHYRPFPIWLRLVRQGNWIFGYYSTTGTNFSYVHAAYVPMDNCVEIGMASFTYVPFAQGTTVFSNVSVTGSPATLEAPDGWSADPVTNAEKATLFPNPAQDLVTVDFGSGAEVETQLVLRNKLGQQVRQLFVEPGMYRQELNVNDLTSGMYIIELHRAGQPVEVLRFIKQ
ncbi:MAG: T9SS type A sorting domain-containing protein [Bacteroidetes bacterium]|nr:T9SS type A sorting domain-containing protein [Bacteroidota bacterium]